MLLGSRRDERGQALILVLGIILVMTLGTTILVQSTLQQEPLVSNALLDHYAYRALEAAEADLLYNLNDNFEFLNCNSADVPGSDGISGVAYTPPLATPSYCSGVTPYRTWESVPGQTGKVPEWFAIDNPQFQGTYSSISNVQIQIVGAAGYNANDMHYQSVIAQFQPQNGFLLNLFWDNVQEVDPAVDSTTCQTWDWNTDVYASSFYLSTINSPITDEGILAQGSGYNTLKLQPPGSPLPASVTCTPSPINFTGGDDIKGPVYSNDSIYVDQNGTGSGWPVFEDSVTTADPYCMFVDPQSTSTDTAAAGCANLNSDITPAAGMSFTKGPAGNKNGGMVYYQKIPTVNQALQNAATADGCVYYGPTDITFVGSKMDVTSDAAYGPTCGTGNNVALPANGVVYVDDVPSQYNCNSSSGASTPTVAQEYEYTSSTGTGAQGDGCRGDAVLSGALYGAVTVATSNNIIIDGDLVYCQDPTATDPSPTCPSTPSGGLLPASYENAPSYPGTSSVLGLIANEFIEVNNPETCGHTGCTTPSSCTGWADSRYWTGATGGSDPNESCVMDPLIIDAAILALNHSFIVINYDDGQNEGNLYVNGAIAQDFRGPVGLTNGSGYSKKYVWDWRLGFIAPPSYLVPAVNGNTKYAYWDLVSSDVNVNAPSCSHITFNAPLTGGTGSLPCEPPP